ncbi:MAG: hypothetical protein KAS76_01230 [Thermoplasmatales archaeon]|nr:hypothetical protein [Thermoplasmatales archaeon]MCK4995792.1 hypothetical protein [Thermoplasmatales archaeon]
MEKMKLFAGIIVFGSLWGFSEVIFGSTLHNTQLPAGAIMTGLFAVGLMVMSRMLYKQRGMQFGMGIVAGALRFFSPFNSNLGFFICSAIAIMAEGLIFELIWYRTSLDFKELKPLRISSSMGVITAYCCYVGGYIVTQILTPVLSSAGFYIENLIVFIPQMLATGLLAALIGGVIVPATLQLKKLDLKIKDRLYYPTALGVSALCWFILVGNWLLLGS